MVKVLSKTLMGLGLFAVAAIGCATPRPMVYAHRDYSQFPEYAKDIALHNIQEILRHGSKSGISEAYASENGIYKDIRVCQQRWDNYSNDPYLLVCEGGATRVLVDLTWDQIEQVPRQQVNDDRCIYFGADKYEPENLKKNVLCAGDPRAGRELLEAIEIYLRERNKSPQ